MNPHQLQLKPNVDVLRWTLEQKTGNKERYDGYSKIVGKIENEFWWYEWMAILWNKPQLIFLKNISKLLNVHELNVVRILYLNGNFRKLASYCQFGLF